MGTLFKLEFSEVCQGGNLNKGVSTCWHKPGAMEKRMQDQRADDNDSGRDLTNFFKEYALWGMDYVCEGVKRRAESWVLARKQAKDMDPAVFGAEWQNIRQKAFDIAKEWAAGETKRAKLNGYLKQLTEAEAVEDVIEKVWQNKLENVDEF